MILEDKNLLDFIKTISNKEFTAIYKTAEFPTVDDKFFLDKNYECKFQYVDITGEHTETLIEYSESLYLFFINQSNKHIMYVFYDVKLKNEFTVLLSSLKRIKNG